MKNAGTEWLRIKDAAGYAGISERTARDWLKQGLRHSRLPSGTVLIRKTWVDEYLAQFEAQPGLNDVDRIVAEVLG